MWIAEYEDGQAIPQFDPDTGHENLWSNVDKSRLHAAGWYPIGTQMAMKIRKASGLITLPTKNPYYRLEMTTGHSLILKRENRIVTLTYRHCQDCDYKWQWSKGVQDPILERLGYHLSDKAQEVNDEEVPICPNCGSYNRPGDPETVKRLGVQVRYTLYHLGSAEGQVARITEWGDVMV